MNDRELLEMAAKAAGIRLLWRCGNVEVETPAILEGLQSEALWNPLQDDGDALRLMVKLDLSSLMVYNHPKGTKRREVWSPNSGYDGGTAAEVYGADPYAATRRAIVRAAAAIGEKM